MNLRKVFFSSLLIVSHFIASAGNHGVYYSELRALKKAPVTKFMFDEDAHPDLSLIQRDITVYKNLTAFQRWVRSVFLMCDVVLVTPETLPQLYAYVDSICKKANIAVPTVFITRWDGFFNAFAAKLLMSTGGIVIGQKLMHDLSDDALEGVVAHEIGHIKHNHINKHLALNFASMGIAIALFVAFLKKVNCVKEVSEEVIIDGESIVKITKELDLIKSGIGLYASGVVASLLPSLIVNKRFEKEADEFASKANGKSKGLIEFFELILQKDQLREEEFMVIYDLLQKSKADLSFSDYYFDLIIRYYLTKFDHLYNKVWKYIYYHTFLGAHPSPEARIEVAKKYLQQEA